MLQILAQSFSQQLLISDVGLEGYNTQAIAVNLAFVFKSFAHAPSRQSARFSHDQSLYPDAYDVCTVLTRPCVSFLSFVMLLIYANMLAPPDSIASISA